MAVAGTVVPAAAVTVALAVSLALAISISVAVVLAVALTIDVGVDLGRRLAGSGASTIRLAVSASLALVTLIPVTVAPLVAAAAGGAPILRDEVRSALCLGRSGGVATRIVMIAVTGALPGARPPVLALGRAAPLSLVPGSLTPLVPRSLTPVALGPGVIASLRARPRLSLARLLLQRPIATVPERGRSAKTCRHEDHR